MKEQTKPKYTIEYGDTIYRGDHFCWYKRDYTDFVEVVAQVELNPSVMEVDREEKMIFYWEDGWALEALSDEEKVMLDEWYKEINKRKGKYIVLFEDSSREIYYERRYDDFNEVVEQTIINSIAVEVEREGDLLYYGIEGWCNPDKLTEEEKAILNKWTEIEEKIRERRALNTNF